MKSEWNKPTLDVLEIRQTMKGWNPGGGGGSDEDDNDCEPISGES
ncbi:paeninodin family lasso peptide [Bacillus haimaensis]